MAKKADDKAFREAIVEIWARKKQGEEVSIRRILSDKHVGFLLIDWLQGIENMSFEQVTSDEYLNHLKQLRSNYNYYRKRKRSKQTEIDHNETILFDDDHSDEQTNDDKLHQIDNICESIFCIIPDDATITMKVSQFKKIIEEKFLK